MDLLLHPVYFPDCTTMACILREAVIWEVRDNYQKQTYRNRCYICTDRGRLMLNIPIRHVGGRSGRQLTREVQIDNSYNWQRQHWRSLETAYRSAPFFEFYESELTPLFETRHDSLLELDLATIGVLCTLLGAEPPQARTSRYETDPENRRDGRQLVQAKSGPDTSQPPYHQVFAERHGFIPGLSALDLLFNEGPAAADYLRDLSLPGYV